MWSAGAKSITMTGTCLDYEEQKVAVASAEDLQLSIPFMIDGLKPVQRKILYSAFKENVVTKIQLYELMGSIMIHSAYHHGENSLAEAIVGMAQDHVGSSNNINLFNSGGQYGMMRHEGEEVDRHVRYLYTNLTPMARLIFSKDDDIILDYKNENGKPIEPIWYAPVIPLILVNGCHGIGTTGFSTDVPKYNPRSLCAYFKCLLNNEEPTVPITPWYKGISPGTTRENEQSFKDCKLQSGKKVTRSKQNMKKPSKEEELLKKFNLKTSTSNMHLFDTQGVLKKYENPEQILDEFYDFRLELYGKRKKMLLPHLQLELVELEHTHKFIHEFIDTRKTKENSSQASEDSRFCKKLLSKMNPKLAQEQTLDCQITELTRQITELTRQVTELKDSTPTQLWLKDLSALDQKLEELGAY